MATVLKQNYRDMKRCYNEVLEVVWDARGVLKFHIDSFGYVCKHKSIRLPEEMEVLIFENKEWKVRYIHNKDLTVLQTYWEEFGTATVYALRKLWKTIDTYKEICRNNNRDLTDMGKLCEAIDQALVVLRWRLPKMYGLMYPEFKWLEVEKGIHFSLHVKLPFSSYSDDSLRMKVNVLRRYKEELDAARQILIVLWPKLKNIYDLMFNALEVLCRTREGIYEYIEQLKAEKLRITRKTKASFKQKCTTKAKIEEINAQQKCINDGQREVRKKFEEIESECEQRETNFMMQHNANTQRRLDLLPKILKAREYGDIATVTNLTQYLRELTLSRSKEKQALVSTMKINNEKLRVADLVSEAAPQFIEGQNLPSDCNVPEEVNAAGSQICADEMESTGIYTDWMVTGDNLSTVEPQTRSRVELEISMDELKVADLVSEAAPQFIEGQNLSSDYDVPQEVNAAASQIFADEMESAGIYTDRMVTVDNLSTVEPQTRSRGELEISIDELKVADLVSEAVPQFIEGQNLSSDYNAPEEVNAAASQICADEMESAGIYTDRIVTGDNLSTVEPQTRSRGELEMSTVPNCSELSDDLFRMVVTRLTTIKDFGASLLVCRRWNLNCLEILHTDSPHFPRLMLSENPNHDRRGFFNLCNNAFHKLELPLVRGRRCYGADQGWIIVVGPDLQVHLFHPLRQVKIDLPMLDAFMRKFGVTDWFNFVRKLIAVQTSHDQFLVMAIYEPLVDEPLGCLAYAKPGDSEWVIVRDASEFNDVTFFQGHYYALRARGILMRCEFSGPNSRARFVEFSPRIVQRADKMYLLVSSGELFAVFRYGSVNNSEQRYKTKRFEVYKYLFNVPEHSREYRKWERVKILKDCAFFVGASKSWSMCASNNVNFQWNRIYFTDDNWKTCGGHDNGVFDMASEKIEWFNLDVDSPPYYSRTIVLTPTIR